MVSFHQIMLISFKEFKGFNLHGNLSFFGGFTLVELLVVVGIIALLSSLTAVVAREARDRGRDMRIQTSLSQVRFEAALIYNRDNSYVILCDANNTLNETNDNLKIIEDEARKQSGSEPECYATEDTYCVSSPLVTGKSYCLDSTGYAEKINNPDCTDFSCH